MSETDAPAEAKFPEVTEPDAQQIAETVANALAHRIPQAVNEQFDWINRDYQQRMSDDPSFQVAMLNMAYTYSSRVAGMIQDSGLLENVRKAVYDAVVAVTASMAAERRDKAEGQAR
jgi:hypothetical protein